MKKQKLKELGYQYITSQENGKEVWARIIDNNEIQYRFYDPEGYINAYVYETSLDMINMLILIKNKLYSNNKDVDYEK